MVKNSLQTTLPVQKLNIMPDSVGQRLDNYLVKKLKGVPRTHIYRIVRAGEVRVNKGRVKPSYRLLEGDIVRVPPVKIASETDKKISTNKAATILQYIIYEDENLLVLNKPSGWAVHGGSGINYGVIEALRAVLPKPQNIELVHRLDKDTSGCLMIAKKRSSLKALHELLQQGKITKEYVALTKGDWRPTKPIEAKLFKNILQSGERIVKVNEAIGQSAKTEFVVQKRFTFCTLVQAKPITGRTHQIRVHAQSVAHPIAGDSKYGDKAFNEMLKSMGLKRLFLHAARLCIPFPGLTKPLIIEAPMGNDLSQILQLLTKGDDKCPSL